MSTKNSILPRKSQPLSKWRLVCEFGHRLQVKQTEICDKTSGNMYCWGSGWKKISRGQIELAVSGFFISVMQQAFIF